MMRFAGCVESYVSGEREVGGDHRLEDRGKKLQERLLWAVVSS